MKIVSRSALLAYSPQQVFDVVADVAAYQEFLPWCERSEVLSQSPTEMTGRLTISRAGVSQSFTTRNEMEPPHRIDLMLVDGPFNELQGHWRFTQLGSDGCKVEMNLRFDFSSSLVNLALGRMFEQAVDTLVDAFCARVESMHSNV